MRQFSNEICRFLKTILNLFHYFHHLRSRLHVTCYHAKCKEKYSKKNSFVFLKTHLQHRKKKGIEELFISHSWLECELFFSLKLRWRLRLRKE